MPQIVPIRDLKNTNKISQMCHDSEDAKLAVAEEQIAAEKVRPARETARELREKYGI